MTSKPSQQKVPVNRAGFESAVKHQAQGPLFIPITQAEVPLNQVVREALEKSATILWEVAPQASLVQELRQRIVSKRWRRVARFVGIVAALLGGLFTIIPLVFGTIAEVPSTLSSLPVWMYVLAAAIFAWLLVVTYEAEEEAGKDDGSLTGDGPPSSARLSLVDQLLIAEGEYREALDQAIQRWILDRANALLGPVYSSLLPDLDPRGLAEIDNPEYEIETKERGELEALIRHMPGGSVGISGPRGAGKSTLLHRVTNQAHLENPTKVRAAIIVDAPVEYDIRDFILHLFAQLCEDVLGAARVESMRTWQRNEISASSGHRNLRSFTPLPAYVGPLLLMIGGGAYLAAGKAGQSLGSHPWQPLALMTMLAGAALTYLMVVGSFPRALGSLLRPFRRLGDERSDLARRAERHLRQIWFQRAFSSGWSGSLKVPLGVQAKSEQGEQLAENQLSLPEIVSLYKQFVRDLAEEGQIRIGIDELDKMDDERARRFLDEIKVIFRVRGCFYFVSVSEDAMAYFERRGMPFRDVFDSSFDAVQQVGHLTYANCHQLLDHRVIGLPIEFVSLACVFGGGLARDVIRAARDICEQKPGSELGAVTAALCVKQLLAKCAAARVAVRQLEDPAQVFLLSQWLSAIEAATSDSGRLLDHCRNFRREFSISLGPPPIDSNGSLKQYREALLIALEVLTFAYFASTLQELMSKLDSEESTCSMIDGGFIDKMAEARKAFAISPAEAWTSISALRSFPLEGEAVNFPSYPGSNRIGGRNFHSSRQTGRP